MKYKITFRLVFQAEIFVDIDSVFCYHDDRVYQSRAVNKDQW